MSKPAKVLYVEDDELDRRSFTRMVHEKALPWDMAYATTLAAARVELARSRFDVVVTDYHLPDGDSTELFDEVRDIPFVLVTSTLEEQLALRTLERGADDYLIKDAERRYLEALPFTVEKTLYRQRIHEREQRLARELRESEERFRLLVEGVRDYAIYMLDPKGHVTTWNQGAEKLKGYTASEIIGQDFARFYTPDEAARGKPQRNLALAAEQGQCAEEGWRVRKDGSRFWASVTITALRDAEGHLRGFAKVTQDLTERKQTEKANARLAAIVESSDDVIISKTLDGTILTWNEAAHRVLGYSAEEVIGQPVTLLLPPDRYKEEEQLLQRLRRGERVEHFETVRVTEDGRELPMSVTISPIRDREGKVVGVSTIARDITEHKRAEAAMAAAQRSAERAKEAAEQANRAKDRFLAVLSHELRTPLTPVLAAVGILQRQWKGDELSLETLEIIQRNVETEAKLIDDLLDTTRIARSQMQLNKQPVPLCEVLRRAVEVCKPDLDARGLHLAVTLGEHAPYFIHADASRLQQAFWNLLQNAIKFTPPGGCVGIRCHRDDHTVVAEVADSGEGIDPEVLRNLFTPFEQGRARETRQFGGLGLGLSITKGLVEMHGGSVTAHSEGKGKGATFRVILPLVKAGSGPLASGPQPAVSAQRESGQALRILLVEDHDDTARALRQLLVAEGHEVETAENVATALVLASSRPFDLILSDLGLPDGHGADLLLELRRRGNTVPAVALSGYGQEQDLRRTREAGFAAHVIKPTTRDQLAGTIVAVNGAHGRGGSAKATGPV